MDTTFEWCTVVGRTHWEWRRRRHLGRARWEWRRRRHLEGHTWYPYAGCRRSCLGRQGLMDQILSLPLSTLGRQKFIRLSTREHSRLTSRVYES